MRLIQVPLKVALCAALALNAWAATSTTTTATHKKKKPASRSTSAAKAKTATTHASSKTSSSSSSSSAKRATTSKSKKIPVVAHRAPQQPSPERYKEIQQALAAKGYFNNEPDGSWGSASVDALKRFQHDQNLTEDGKIGSLSLIALGLGPKREPVADAEQKTP